MNSFVVGLVVSAVGAVVVNGWVGEENWDVVRDGQFTREFRPVRFERHPIRNGVKTMAYPAYYIGNGYEAFGQTFTDERGKVCARFPGPADDVKPDPIITCDGFRVLTNRNDFVQEFFFVKPEDRGHVQPHVEFVAFRDRAVIIYDPDEDSSFFGTWSNRDGEEVVTGVDYDNRQVEYRGASVVSGDYVLYIARDK